MANSIMPPTFLASAMCAKLEANGLEAIVYFADDSESRSAVFKAVVRHRQSDEKRSTRFVLTWDDLTLSLDDILEKVQPIIAGLTLERTPDGPMSGVQLEEQPA